MHGRASVNKLIYMFFSKQVLFYVWYYCYRYVRITAYYQAHSEVKPSAR